jgi:hypothetical protein
MITTAEGTPEEVAQAIKKAVESRTSHSKGEHAFAILILSETPSGHEIVDQGEFEQLMAESASDTVSFGRMDASREAMYTRMEGE